jgi:hypothetical protein
MRVVVDLHHTEAGTVYGAVMAGAEDVGEPHRFAGWLELLRILEALAPPETPASAGGSSAEPP